MSEAGRLRTAWAFAGYVLIAVIGCVALGRLSAWIVARQLLEQAQQQRSRVEAGQPLWQWQLRKPRDLIAGRAFGNAKVDADEDALRITSEDGAPFELGLPVAWSLDLRHWPILQLQMQSSAPGTLGLVWQGGQTPACMALAAHALMPDLRSARIDLRGLHWTGTEPGACATPGIAQMLRLRVQIPRNASLRIAFAELLTTEPIPRLQDVAIDLPQDAAAQQLQSVTLQARNWAMPLFRLPQGISAETMLTLRDRLRATWPAALIVPAGAAPEIEPTGSSHIATQWIACAIYLLALAWLVLRPLKGRLRPWIEIAGCLLGPLWLVMGLNWGLRPTVLGVAAFGGGLACALAIERHHLSRLWRWPESTKAWLWPLAAPMAAALLIVFLGHALGPQRWTHVLAYFGWAWLQQWLMFNVLLRRFEQIVHRPGWAIVPVALVFALLHTPNGMLMQLCFVAELWWAWCFLRSRSVLPIAFAHAAAALLVESGLSGGMLRSLEVSARFFL